MADIEKVKQGLRCCDTTNCNDCPFKNEKDETYPLFCKHVLNHDALSVIEQMEQEAKVGKWIPIETPTGVEAFGVKEMTVMDVRCSVCGSEEDVSFTGYKYCPRCGAKMEGR